MLTTNGLGQDRVEVRNALVNHEVTAYDNASTRYQRVDSDSGSADDYDLIASLSGKHG